MRNTAIDRLVWEGKAQDLKFSPLTPEYKTYSMELDACVEELENIVPADKKYKVQLLVDAAMRACNEENFEAYRQGYSLGTRLTAEAFIIGEGKDE